MSAALADAAASTTKAVVARRSFFIVDPLSDVGAGPRPPLPPFPRQRPRTLYASARNYALRVLEAILARAAGISCDRSATPAGKVVPGRHLSRLSDAIFRRIYAALLER